MLVNSKQADQLIGFFVSYLIVKPSLYSNIGGTIYSWRGQTIEIDFKLF